MEKTDPIANFHALFPAQKRIQSGELIKLSVRIRIGANDQIKRNARALLLFPGFSYDSKIHNTDLPVL